MKTFRTKNGLQTYIRKNGTGNLHEFRFEKINWRMENYDLKGRLIIYRAWIPDDNFIEILTSDRYSKTGFKDAGVNVYSPLFKTSR